MKKYQLNYSRTEFERVLREVYTPGEHVEIKDSEKLVRRLFMLLQVVILGGAAAYYFTGLMSVLLILALVALAMIGFIYLLNTQIGASRKKAIAERNAYLDRIEHAGQHELSFDDIGITLSNRAGTFRESWSNFSHAMDGKDYLFLRHFAEGKSILLPQKSLPAEAFKELRKTAITHVKKQ